LVNATSWILQGNIHHLIYFIEESRNRKPSCR